MCTRSIAAATAVLSTVLLAACAGQSEASGLPSSPPGGAVTAPTTPPSRTPWTASPLSPPDRIGPPPAPPPSAPSSPPASPPGKVPRELTATGTVVEGVEAGCLLLRTATADYLLVVPRDVDGSLIRAGARLTVSGHSQPDILSHCQQGEPFVVSHVEPA